MTKLSPLQRVRQEHGSKDELVDKILDAIEVPADEDPLDFEERLSTTSNTKLLRLWESYQTVQDQFGSKQGLIDKVTTARFPGGNEDYADKLETYTLPRLLGLARDQGLL